MSQSKSYSPFSSSSRLGRLSFASPYFLASLGCLFLLEKVVLWQISSYSAAVEPLAAWFSYGLQWGCEFLLVASLAFTLDQNLRALHVSTRNSLRGGFLGAWLISWIVTFPLWRVSPPLAFLGASGSLLAAFCGALLATARVVPLWEENSPPKEEVQRRVRAQHLLSLGAEVAVPRWKRALDIGLCLVSLPFAIPLSLLIALGIWLEDPGAIFFVKNSVGRWGRNFRQIKFRTMILGAELGSGPTLALENDPRALRFGRFLRKSALDELPQLWNILRGEMSFVGPRPQRTLLVDTYLQALPQYAERHRLPPGLSGLAQVAGSYYLTPLQKLRFDRLYIRHASLGYDLRLLAAAFALTFYYRWKPGWNGRLPRHWLHSAKHAGGFARPSTGQR
ncbi:MAG: sugar transferase [Anaerolineales bacterium]|nr:sugar transferase [Anaerolineales bacterium]MCS7248915.1 sugar transferase [Anaerolineales bacterium]MDW8162728.1 sugar transferase [Anaerolineales bacterium]MDW8447118.1 sugar transferase [Anaerolineales bacterium]